MELVERIIRANESQKLDMLERIIRTNESKITEKQKHTINYKFMVRKYNHSPRRIRINAEK
ncbi:15295_t:CDS:1, partial [Cetraspora pellucida]